MKKILKAVYYCEYCHKRGMSAAHMRRHEGRCTGNPERKCGVCEDDINLKTIVESFKKRFTLTEIIDPLINDPTHTVNWIGKPATLQEIRNAVSDCPACILAVFRQTGMNRHYFGFKFDFKTELAKAMHDWKMEESERDYYNMY